MKPTKDQIRGYMQGDVDDETAVIACRAYYADASYREHPAYLRIDAKVRKEVDAMTQAEAVEKVSAWIADIEAP